MDPKDKILLAAHDVFMKHGLKSVTMDDVSRELGISKKTLYQFVSDKSDLVMQITQAMLKRREDMVCEVFGNSSNAIEEMIRIFNLVAGEFRKTNPTLLYELRKYYPESWLLFKEHKKSFIGEQIRSNMRLGIEQGLYRNDFPVEVINLVYLEAIETLTDPSKFSPDHITIADAYKSFIQYHLRGIASQAGLVYINQRFKEIS